MKDFLHPLKMSLLCERLVAVALLLSVSVCCLAHSGAVEYWGGAKSLNDMAAFVQAFFNITIELLNVIAALITFYSAAQIYIKLQSGEEGFTKNVSMLIGAVVYFLVMLVVFPAFFNGHVSGHGGLWSLIFG